MADLSEVLCDRGSTVAAADYALSSWAPNTRRQYDYQLRNWNAYCAENDLDPQSVTDIVLGNFLASLRQRGYAYSTVASHKAAVTSFLSMVSTVPDLPLSDRVVKGIFREAPPAPKYGDIWDVRSVIASVKGWGPTADLSLKLLTQKTAILLALASPKRVSELASLSLTKLQKGRDRWIFHLGMTKNRTMGGDSHSAEYARFRSDPEICPVSTLEVYLDRTDYRDRSENVLISFVSPFGAVTPPTISRWIKDVLTSAGFEAYGAHSTRAAATSAAHRAGLSAPQIMKAANWAPGGSTFERFYLKGTVVDSFQNKVLSSRLMLNIAICEWCYQ